MSIFNDIKKGLRSKPLNPLMNLVPGTRIELVQSLGPRDFKSLASTNSATQADDQYLYFRLMVVKGLLLQKINLPQIDWI